MELTASASLKELSMVLWHPNGVWHGCWELDEQHKSISVNLAIKITCQMWLMSDLLMKDLVTFRGVGRSSPAVIGARVWHTICNGARANMKFMKKWSGQNRTSRTGSYAYDIGDTNSWILAFQTGVSYHWTGIWNGKWNGMVNVHNYCVTHGSCAIYLVQSNRQPPEVPIQPV